MIDPNESGLLDRLRARLADAPTVVRLSLIVIIGIIALWAVGLALTLFLAVLAGGLALAAAVATVMIGGSLLARRKPELPEAAVGEIVRTNPAGSPE